MQINTNKNPPHMVKSVLVVNAYTVNANVIPKVIKAAVKTKYYPVVSAVPFGLYEVAEHMNEIT